MPLISVKHASPLSDEQLSQLLAVLTETYVEVTGASSESVQVLIEHVPTDRWSVGGRSLRTRNAATNGS